MQHCDGIFDGFLVMAWMGESEWVGLRIVLWEVVEGGGRNEADAIVISPTVVLVWCGCYC